MASITFRRGVVSFSSLSTIHKHHDSGAVSHAIGALIPLGCVIRIIALVAYHEPGIDASSDSKGATVSQTSVPTKDSVRTTSPSRVAGAASRPAITADEFKTAFRNHPGGVAVITADIGNGPVGLTATSVISASVAPNILAFSVSEHSSSTPTILRADTVVIHLIGAEQVEIAKLCATSGIDRFADESIWTELPSGEPYFPAAAAWIRGRVVNSMAAGGSSIVAVEALEASPSLSAGTDLPKPLVYHNRAWHVLGDASLI